MKIILILFIFVITTALMVTDAARQNNKRKSDDDNNGGNKKHKHKKNPRNIITEIPELGRVRGIYEKTAWTGIKIMKFIDIQYAEAKRFKAAEPVKPWKNVRRASNNRRACPSLQDIPLVKRTEEKQDIENCLTLSISTRSLQKTSPVMVYFHGEFLYEGTNNEAAPEYLLERDVVLVSIRYRLGPFGFLSTMSDEIPGNAAVTDAIVALEWIQKNIHAFGGNPDSVTLFGQVGGAALIHVLTMSPAVPKGLFHRVIYQSGTALTPAFVTDSPLKFTRDIAKEAGCKGIEDIDKLNWCFENMTPSHLLKSFSRHGVKNSPKGIGYFGGVQFVVGGPSKILPEHPGKLMRSKKIRYYPTMGGVVKNSGTFLLRELFEDHFNDTIPDNKKITPHELMEFAISQTNGDDPTNAWRKYSEKEYFTKNDLHNGTFIDMIPGLIDMCGTIPFKNPILLTLQANAEMLPNQTFLYSFDYEGEFHRYLEDLEDTFNLPFELGASLTDELLYLFPWPNHAKFLNYRDTKIARSMVDLWTSFARTGVPTSYSISEWPPMTDANGPYLKINRISTIGRNFFDEYSATIREDTAGYSLVSLEYFENLLELDKERKEEESDEENHNNSDDSSDNHGDEDEHEQDETEEVNTKKKRKNKRKETQRNFFGNQWGRNSVRILNNY